MSLRRAQRDMGERRRRLRLGGFWSTVSVTVSEAVL
jgi:hypothetical protein